mgnify:CR=1 FL=1
MAGCSLSTASPDALALLTKHIHAHCPDARHAHPSCPPVFILAPHLASPTLAHDPHRSSCRPPITNRPPRANIRVTLRSFSFPFLPNQRERAQRLISFARSGPCSISLFFSLSRARVCSFCLCARDVVLTYRCRRGVLACGVGRCGVRRRHVAAGVRAVHQHLLDHHQPRLQPQRCHMGRQHQQPAVRLQLDLSPQSCTNN